MPKPLKPADYLKKILTARVYDVAVESALEPAKNKFAWQRFRADVTLPESGYYEVWARATDMNGTAQPPVVPGWNPRGYGNNMQHRIALIAT